eukprot:Blabericola_migrator_1__8329@NODE_432_length_8561_cov_341_131269_g338_i1_p6_GENE_NODE_432_length_8561_cov_341_131269_g338_i1NODE_432_length_8561_cov_341_131269_g338_i1_p6_ORF_typecomplete_len202_score23_83G_path_suppress/PF15991_5/0_29KAR9/PF08580_10/8_8_NODE_432_length_8561_cov_341_131269_g338_i151245729
MRSFLFVVALAVSTVLADLSKVEDLSDVSLQYLLDGLAGDVPGVADLGDLLFRLNKAEQDEERQPEGMSRLMRCFGLNCKPTNDAAQRPGVRPGVAQNPSSPRSQTSGYNTPKSQPSSPRSQNSSPRSHTSGYDTARSHASPRSQGSTTGTQAFTPRDHIAVKPSDLDLYMPPLKMPKSERARTISLLVEHAQALQASPRS